MRNTHTTHKQYYIYSVYVYTHTRSVAKSSTTCHLCPRAMLACTCGCSQSFRSLTCSAYHHLALTAMHTHTHTQHTHTHTVGYRVDELDDHLGDVVAGCSLATDQHSARHEFSLRVALDAWRRDAGTTSGLKQRIYYLIIHIYMFACIDSRL